MMGTGRFLAAGACAVAASLLIPIAASAHAFLVQTSPAAGQRLSTSPPSLTLQFSEAVAPGGTRVTVRNAGGELVKISPANRAAAGDLVNVGMPVLPPDVYAVQWLVVSADDGHFSAGSFAFGVGTTANIPAATHGEPYGPDTGILEALPERDGLKTLVVFLPASQIWIQLSIDKSQRLRAETIVDPGHLIERSFSYP